MSVLTDLMQARERLARVEALALEWEKAHATVMALNPIGTGKRENVVGLTRAGCYLAHARSLREALA